MYNAKASPSRNQQAGLKGGALLPPPFVMPPKPSGYRRFPLSGSSFGKYFNAKAFFIALFVGILLVYLFAPNRHIVHRFPSPHNVNSVVYSDTAQPGTCYRYEAERVACETVPKDTIKPQPLVIEDPTTASQ